MLLLFFGGCPYGGFLSHRGIEQTPCSRAWLDPYPYGLLNSQSHGKSHGVIWPCSPGIYSDGEFCCDLTGQISYNDWQISSISVTVNLTNLRYLPKGSKRTAFFLVGGWATPLNNMKVNWDDYSQYMGKSYWCSKPPTSSCVPGYYFCCHWSHKVPKYLFWYLIDRSTRNGKNSPVEHHSNFESSYRWWWLIRWL